MQTPESGHKDFRLFLQDELLRRCRANPRYSIRAFARSLNTDYSTLAKVLRGKRKLGKRATFGLGAQLGMSPDIVDEYVRVGERLNGRYPDVEIQPIVALVVQNATMVPSVPLRGAVCDDPDDDKFLACALASGTDTVVSGDKKLRAVSGYEGINVLTPRQFVDRCL